MANTAVAVRPPPRLPKPRHVNVDDDTWEIATEALWPTATNPNSIAQALTYCRVRGLDPYRKPVHIVARWNAALGREVEQVMPGQNELLVTAERTGEFAGVEKPVFGKPITKTFKGRKKTREGWVEAEVTLTFPETIEITVYRFVKGEKCSFISPIRWEEEYQRVGGGALPNEMWARRVYDQAQKVALAASLRIAFADVVPPEEDDLSIMRQPGEIIDAEPQRPVPPSQGLGKPDTQMHKAEPPPLHDPDTGEIGPRTLDFTSNEESWQQWGSRYLAAVETAATEEEIEAWIEANATKLAEMQNESGPMFSRLDARVNKHRIKIKQNAATQGVKTDASSNNANDGTAGSTAPGTGTGTAT